MLQGKTHKHSRILRMRGRCRMFAAAAALLFLSMIDVCLANPVHVVHPSDIVMGIYMLLLPVGGFLFLFWVALLFRKNKYYADKERMGILKQIVGGAFLSGFLIGVIFYVIAAVRMIRLALGKPTYKAKRDNDFAVHTAKRNKNSDFIAQLEKAQER